MTLRLPLTFALCVVCIGAELPSADARAQVPRLTLTQTLRLDANAEDFPSVSAAFTGPRGIIVVAVVEDSQFRLYDSTGKRIATVGRKGAGPGEFEQPYRFGWLADTLWIYDISHRRFTLISPTGRLIRTTMLPTALNEGIENGSKDATSGVYTYSPSAYFGDGSSVGSAMLIAGRTPEGADKTVTYVVRATAAGDVTRLALQPSAESSSMSVRRDGSEWALPIPFMFLRQRTFAYDGSRFGFLTTEITSPSGGTYTVRVFTSKGETVFARSYPFKGVPIPARAVDSAVTAISTIAKSWPPDVVAQMQKTARSSAPPVYAPVGSLLFGKDNTIWVTQRATAEGVVALVHNSKGDPIASVVVPPRSRLLEVSLTHILVSETDDDGLASVVRYRVTGRTCGPPECR